MIELNKVVILALLGIILIWTDLIELFYVTIYVKNFGSIHVKDFGSLFKV